MPKFVFCGDLNKVVQAKSNMENNMIDFNNSNNQKEFVHQVIDRSTKKTLSQI